MRWQGARLPLPGPGGTADTDGGSVRPPLSLAAWAAGLRALAAARAPRRCPCGLGLGAAAAPPRRRAAEAARLRGRLPEAASNCCWGTAQRAAGEPAPEPRPEEKAAAAFQGNAVMKTAAS
mmetsp:Transcript_145177/g.404588  ORF Transcript_145177/g.404588 Transcript_145177/m.404588 type:complete len:121 (+) Transcript_145177:177-539(+)